MNLHNGDMSDVEVISRYEKANIRVIAVSDAIVFAALMDAPKLIKERSELKQRIVELEARLEKKND